MTKMTRQIVGYDPQTERVVFEHAIPPDKWGSIMPLVQRNADDPNYAYNYPLEASLANDIMRLFGQRLEQNVKYFLECDATD